MAHNDDGRISQCSTTTKDEEFTPSGHLDRGKSWIRGSTDKINGIFLKSNTYAVRFTFACSSTALLVRTADNLRACSMRHPAIIAQRNRLFFICISCFILARYKFLRLRLSGRVHAWGGNARVSQQLVYLNLAANVSGHSVTPGTRVKLDK